MANPGAYLQLMRPVNLGILLLMQLLILGKSSAFDMEMLRMPDCVLLAIAILATAAAGNVINDVHDTATDAVNKPDKQLVPAVVSQGQAMRLYTGLLLMPLIAAWFVGIGFFMLCMVSSVLLHFYTRELKGIPLAGNLLIATLTAAAVFSTRLGLYDTTLLPFAELSALAFFVNLARELVKDVEDIPGDLAAGIRTYAVRFGPKRTMRLGAAFLLPAALLAFAPLLLGMESLSFRIHYLIAGAFLLVITHFMISQGTVVRPGKVSFWLKVSLLYGLSGILWL